jgi:hypothetical protein
LEILMRRPLRIQVLGLQILAGAVLAASLCLAASAAALADAPPWGSSIWPSLGCTSGICTIGDGNSSIAFTVPVTAQDGSLPPGLDLEQATLTEDGVLATSTTANTSTVAAQVTNNAGNLVQQSLNISLGTGNLDLVVITQVTCNTKQHQLIVTVNELNTDVTVTVMFPGAKHPRRLHPSGDGHFHATISLPSSVHPTTVTVASSGGATANASVVCHG